MKNIDLNKFKKAGKDYFDAEKFINAEGETDTEALDALVEAKPLLPKVPEGRLKKLSIVEHRDRYTEFPKRLPTRNMMPMPVDEHEMIGFFENKQNLYLLIANAYNAAMQKIEDLEAEIKKLKGLK